MWSVNDGLSGNLRKTCWKPAGNLCSRFILLKTYQKSAGSLHGGFQRFPNNPSLTDHMVVCSTLLYKNSFPFLLSPFLTSHHCKVFGNYMIVYLSIIWDKYIFDLPCPNVSTTPNTAMGLPTMFTSSKHC